MTAKLLLADHEERFLRHIFCRENALKEASKVSRASKLQVAREKEKKASVWLTNLP